MHFTQLLPHTLAAPLPPTTTAAGVPPRLPPLPEYRAQPRPGPVQACLSCCPWLPFQCCRQGHLWRRPICPMWRACLHNLSLLSLRAAAAAEL